MGCYIEIILSLTKANHDTAGELWIELIRLARDLDLSAFSERYRLGLMIQTFDSNSPTFIWEFYTSYTFFIYRVTPIGVEQLISPN